MGILINQGRQIGGLSEQDQANIGKVTQTETTTGAEYELLFSETAADATTHTEEARKSQYFKFNPHNKIFTVGTRKTTEPDNYTPIVTPGDYSTCLGYNVATEGDYCFSEGQNTFSAGTAAHAEGRYTHAGGNGAHAEGCYTIAWGDYQHVQGKYNVKDTNLIYAHIVGNGTGSNARSNAYALRWDGQQDVTNDIVRVDSGGTWDGANKSLEDSFKWNIGECSSYDADAVIYYDYYEIAEIEVNPGTAEDNYEHQDDISNPIIFEISQIVNSKIESIIEFTGYSVLELAFKFNTATNETEVLQFLSSNSLDYYIQKDSNDSNIWHLYGHYRTVTNASPRIDNKSVLHRIYGSGVHDNITIIMQNVTSQTVTSRIIPTRNFVKLKDAKSFVRNSAIANNYDSTATYEVGDLCFYQSTPYSNVLYVCNTTISTPEDFNSSHWTRVTLPEYFVKKSGDTMTGTLIGKSDGSSWKTARDHASFKKIGAQNTGTYYPILSVRGYNYDWSMGTLGNSAGSALYFVRTFDSDYSGTGNLTQNFVLYGGSAGAASSYTIAHSGNVGTGDSNGQVKIAGTNVSVKGLGTSAYVNKSDTYTSTGTTTATTTAVHNAWVNAAGVNNVTFTWNTTNCNAGGFNGYRIGKMVTFYVFGDLKAAKGTWTDTTIGTLSVKAQGTWYDTGRCNDGTVMGFQISDNASSLVLRTLNKANTDKTFRVTMTFICR